MYPTPTHIYMDYSIDKHHPGKPIEKVPFEKITEKELLIRLVALGQSFRSMMIFFVWIAIIQMVLGIVLITSLVK